MIEDGAGTSPLPEGRRPQEAGLEMKHLKQRRQGYLVPTLHVGMQSSPLRGADGPAGRVEAADTEGHRATGDAHDAERQDLLPRRAWEPAQPEDQWSVYYSTRQPPFLG